MPIHITAQVRTGIPAWNGFIPKGFELLDSASGNLNKDAYRDMVLILKNKKEADSGDLTRPLLLLAGTAGGQFKLAASNDSVVLCRACGGVMGDPYQAVVIKNGYFSIEHYGGSSWRWTRIITFRFDTKTGNFLLHRDAGTSFHSSEPGKVEEIVTNKKAFGNLRFEAFSHAADQ